MKTRIAAVTVLLAAAVAATALLGRKNGPGLPERSAVLLHLRDVSLPLNNPDTVPARNASHMKDSDLVFGVVRNGKARAYPRWILVSYHVVNDTFEGPLLVNQCEICSAAAAFLPEIGRFTGRSLVFHPCGSRAGTYEICDAQTASRWHPFTGRAVEGPLAGESLARIPVVTTTWKEWREQFPSTDVVFASKELLKREHGRHENAQIGKPHIPDAFLKDAKIDDKRLPLEALVLGIRAPGRAAALPLGSLSKTPCWYALERDGKKLAVFHDGKFAASAFRLPGEESYAARGGFLHSPSSEGLWDSFGLPARGSNNQRQLIPADAYVTEWYEWVTSHPDSEILAPGICL